MVYFKIIDCERKSCLNNKMLTSRRCFCSASISFVFWSFLMSLFRKSSFSLSSFFYLSSVTLTLSCRFLISFSFRAIDSLIEMISRSTILLRDTSESTLFLRVEMVPSYSYCMSSMIFSLSLLSLERVSLSELLSVFKSSIVS